MKENKIAIVGLGYVGLPLAAAFAHQYPVIRNRHKQTTRSRAKPL